MTDSAGQKRRPFLVITIVDLGEYGRIDVTLPASALTSFARGYSVRPHLVKSEHHKHLYAGLPKARPITVSSIRSCLVGRGFSARSTVSWREPRALPWPMIGRAFGANPERFPS